MGHLTDSERDRLAWGKFWSTPLGCVVGIIQTVAAAAFYFVVLAVCLRHMGIWCW